MLFRPQILNVIHFSVQCELYPEILRSPTMYAPWTRDSWKTSLHCANVVQSKF